MQPAMSSPFSEPRFCITCGTPLTVRVVDERPRHVCPSCGQIHWLNAKPCAGALVLRNGKVLLIRRAIEPFRDYVCPQDRRHPRRVL